MRHQKLTELETLLKEFLVIMTNQSYGMNVKHGYRYTWTKGTGKIELDGKYYTNYFTLRFYMVDKNKSVVGKEIDLIVNHYPIIGLQTREKLEEEAYKELLLNGMRCLVNNTYACYIQHQDKKLVEPTDVELNTIVEELKEQAKTPKIII